MFPAEFSQLVWHDELCLGSVYQTALNNEERKKNLTQSQPALCPTHSRDRKERQVCFLKTGRDSPTHTVLCSKFSRVNTCERLGVD